MYLHSKAPFNAAELWSWLPVLIPATAASRSCLIPHTPPSCLRCASDVPKGSPVKLMDADMQCSGELHHDHVSLTWSSQPGG